MRINYVEAVAPLVLIVHWQKGRVDLIDLTDWSESGGEGFEALRNFETFRAMKVINHGAAVAWDDDGDLAIDAHHLRLLATTQATTGS